MSIAQDRIAIPMKILQKSNSVNIFGSRTILHVWKLQNRPTVSTPSVSISSISNTHNNVAVVDEGCHCKDWVDCDDQACINPVWKNVINDEKLEK